MSKVLLLFMLIALSLYSPFVGAAKLELSQLFVAGSFDREIFLQLRLPRLMLAFSAGALLSISGWLFQTLFRNALMTPYTLGISGGAVLGTGVAIVFGLDTLFLGVAWSAMFGFGGAMASVLLLLWLARYLPNNASTSLLLLGIALSFFFSAALTVLFYLSSAVQSHAILRYTMGSLSTMGYTPALMSMAAALLLVALLRLKRHELRLLGVHEEQAQLKGIDTKKMTRMLLLTASLAIGILISVTGPIGFVGLIIPHMVRRLYRAENTALIWPSFLYGGLFLAACDTLSRMLEVHSEIPIGIVTAFIGGPFFVYLIIRGHRV